MYIGRAGQSKGTLAHAKPRSKCDYMRHYALSESQAAAIRARNVLQLIAAGGNAYYLAKFAGIFGLDMQDIGAQQTGMSKDAFKAKLRAAGRCP